MRIDVATLTCREDTVRPEWCHDVGSSGETVGICDPSTGLCVPQEPCSDIWSFDERCIIDDTYRVVCDPGLGWSVALPCSDCSIDEESGRATCSAE